jgi:hypothetical protein
MIRFLLISLFIFTKLLSDENPKLFSSLATPIYDSTKPLLKCVDIKSLKDKIIKFNLDAQKVKKHGFKAQESQDKGEIKLYLKELRALKKEYDYLLHLLEGCVDASIKNKDYELFYKLTSYDFDGFLKSKRLKERVLEFYAQNKDKKSSKILDKKLEEKKLLKYSQELYNEVIESSFSSNAKYLDKNNSVIISAKRDFNSVKIYLQNTNLYDVTIKVDSNYKNIDAHERFKNIFVIKANSKILFAKLNIVATDSSYGYRYRWIKGSKDAIHDDNYLYMLPYSNKVDAVLSQGFDTIYSHKGRSKYAVDFAMSEGSEVIAARGGVVIKTKSSSNVGGYDKKYSAHGNYITIYHNDGTFGLYYHLKKGGVVVKVGQKVKKGQLIGYSGNTGYSSGPHLHFAVFKATKDMMTHTIKIKFITKDGVITEPKMGRHYVNIIK